MQPNPANSARCGTGERPMPPQWSSFFGELLRLDALLGQRRAAAGTGATDPAAVVVAAPTNENGAGAPGQERPPR